MTEDDTVTMSDKLTPKYEEESSNFIVGGSIQSQDDNLIDIDLDDETLQRLFIGNELAFKLITKWSQDPVEKGFSVKTDEEDSDFARQVEQYKQDLNFNSKLMELNKFVNVFGSAGLGYDLVDSSSSPEQKVDPEDVEEIDKLRIIRQDQVDSYDIDDGEISAYDLEDGYDIEKIDESRLYHARYYHIKGHPEGFGLLHPLFTSLKVFENVKFGMGQAFYVGGTGFPVLSIDGLDNMDDDDAQELKSEFMTDVLKNPGMMLDKEKSEVEFKGSQGKALDPEPYVDKLLDIIGTVVGSKRILTGAEPGGVEGSKTDQEEYFGDVSSFQNNKLTPIVRDFIDRLIDYGLVEKPENGYLVEWNELYEKDEERQAEIDKKKSSAFLNLTTAGLPAEVAAKEVGLDEETVEALQEEGSLNFSPGSGSSSGGSGSEPSGNADGSNDKRDQDGRYYDKSASQETLEVLRDLEGYDSEKYWSDDCDHDHHQDGEITKPIYWSDDLYSQYKDLREELQEEVLGDLVDRIIQGVEDNSPGADSLSDKIKDKISRDKQKKLDRYAFSKRVERELDKMEEESREKTRDALKGAFQVGADKGAEAFGARTTEVFDKHRREIMDETFDKYITPAYADTKKEIAEKVNDSVREYFQTQDMGIDDLKRSIRQVKGGSSAVDYRFERIARTETGRIRNISYIDETSRRGRSKYDWVGPPIEASTPQVCITLTDRSPMDKATLMSLSAGGMPHINCRRTAAVAMDAIGDEGIFLDDLQQRFLRIEFDVDEDDLDEAFEKFQMATNKTLSEMQRWTNSECSSKASLSRDPNERVIRLLKKNKDEWTEEDIQDAMRVWSFVQRMKAQRPENPREGPGDCSSKWAISLKNWGYDPFKED